MSLHTRERTPVAQGGTCTNSCGPLKLGVTSVSGSKRYRVDFQSFGEVDPTAISSISWTASKDTATFDFSLDDVGLY